MSNGVNMTDATITRAAKQIAKGLVTVGVEPDIALHQGFVLIQRFEQPTEGDELQPPFTYIYKRAADKLS